MLTREEYVKKNGPMAIAATKGTGIFPETLLAMDITESSRKINGVYYAGESKLAKKYNNHFGIKADANYKGPKVLLTTREVYKDKTVIIKDYFRIFPNKEKGYKAYIDFLKDNSRYEKAGVFSAPDYVTQIARIAKAGYATDPNYKSVVSDIAEQVKKYLPKMSAKNLQEFDFSPFLGIAVGLLVDNLTKQKNGAN